MLFVNFLIDNYLQFLTLFFIFYQTYNINAFKQVNNIILQGVYTLTGLDASLINKNNLPKAFFYGDYKGYVKFKTKNDTLAGCIAVEVKVIRPWDIPQH